MFKTRDLLAGIAAAVSGVLTGCSIHPIPEDGGTRDATVAIAKKIRCETKLAIEALDRKFDSTEIAFDFEFTITENNKATSGATFTLPFLSGGSFKLAIGGGDDRTRSGKRSFSLDDTFKETLLEDCSQKALAEQFRYPITGTVGMAEIIGTFLKLNDLHLQEVIKKDTKSYIDVLEFTTVVTANANPTITLNPVADQFRLTEAKGEFSASRTDKHKLTVGLSIPVAKAPVAAKSSGSPIRATGAPARRPPSAARQALDKNSAIDALARAIQAAQPPR